MQVTVTDMDSFVTILAANFAHINETLDSQKRFEIFGLQL